jgi:hypothetical protein
MQFKHRISFIGTDAVEDDGAEEQSTNKLMEQMCKHKDMLSGGMVPKGGGGSAAASRISNPLEPESKASIPAAVRRVGDKMSIFL